MYRGSVDRRNDEFRRRGTSERARERAGSEFGTFWPLWSTIIITPWLREGGKESVRREGERVRERGREREGEREKSTFFQASLTATH
jgi:hypothetical protein